VVKAGAGDAERVGEEIRLVERRGVEVADIDGRNA
jgi:hypothetical protein